MAINVSFSICLVLLLMTCAGPKEIIPTTFTIDTLINGFQIETSYADLDSSSEDPLTHLPSYHSATFISSAEEVSASGISLCREEPFYGYNMGTLLLIDKKDTLTFELRSRPEGRDSLYIRGALDASKYQLIRKGYTPEEMLGYLSGTEKKIIDCKGKEHIIEVKTIVAGIAFLDSVFYFEKTQ